MGRLCRIFVIFIVAYTAAGCFSPVGSIDGPETVDLLWVEPKCVEFKLGDTFIPSRDMAVFALYGGVVRSISLSLVEIGIADAAISENLKPVRYDTGCPLDKLGKKIIVVRYGGLSTSYYIEVLDSVGNETTTGIITIIWAE